MNNYKLVFDGTISDGYQVTDVKKNLAALLKANASQIELLFSKPEVVIKKNMDYESAKKYQIAMQKAGTVCQVIEASQGQSAIPQEKAAPVPDSGPSSDRLVMENPSEAVVDRTGTARTHHFTNEPVKEIGETALPKDFQHSSSEKNVERESVDKKIGKGIGDIIAGVVLIAIGLLWGGSIFLGTADAFDIFFDVLGLFWIGKGVYKIISLGLPLCVSYKG
jgi:hypothetical protein